MYDVFISYSRKDTPTAEKITAAFDKAGITYFIDKKGIGGGADFPEVLSQAIKESKIFLLLASENAYASSFTRAEVTYAFSNVKNSALLPYLIDNSTMPSNMEFLFSNVNWMNIKTRSSSRKSRASYPIRRELIGRALSSTNPAELSVWSSE